jgi:hypothetical protein
MGGLTWEQIKKYAIDACGETSALANEVYDHLSEAYSRVCAIIDVPELIQTSVVTSVASADGINQKDFLELDRVIYDIRSIWNQTDSVPMYPEPAGMLGRQRFLTNAVIEPSTGMGKPANGSATFYWRDGNRLWLRDTPIAPATFQVRYRIEVPSVDSTMLQQHALTPDHYDWAIIYGAAANFYNAHPAANKVVDAEANITLAGKYEALFQAKLQQPTGVFEEENESRYETMRLAGYRLGPRSRW